MNMEPFRTDGVGGHKFEYVTIRTSYGRASATMVSVWKCVVCGSETDDDPPMDLGWRLRPCDEVVVQKVLGL